MRVPPIRTWSSVEVVRFESSDFLHLRDAGPYRDPPAELFLREAREIAPAEGTEVAAFTERFGTVALAAGDSGPLLRFLPRAYQTPVPSFPTLFPTPKLSRLERLIDMRELHPYYVVPLEVATFHLRAIRALAGHRIADQEGESVARAWRAEGFDVRTPRQAWHTFEGFVNAALRPYSPWLWFTSDEQPEERLGTEQLPEEVERGNAYTAMALQIANHIVEDAHYRRCSSETCGRWFFRQRGEARYRGRTKGVEFCSVPCRDAQRKRNQRRRARGAKL